MSSSIPSVFLAFENHFQNDVSAKVDRLIGDRVQGLEKLLGFIPEISIFGEGPFLGGSINDSRVVLAAKQEFFWDCWKERPNAGG